MSTHCKSEAVDNTGTRHLVCKLVCSAQAKAALPPARRRLNAVLLPAHLSQAPRWAPRQPASVR